MAPVLAPTALPARPFLDWPVITDPAAWAARIALIGLPHSEPYPGDPWPNDQARAPDAIRRQSGQFCDGPDHWDFDLGGPLGEILPAAIDCGNVPWEGGSYDAHLARTSGLLRLLWRQGTQVVILGGDHGVTIAALDALDAVGEPVYVLHIDAHLDWREEVGGVRRGYSSPLYWASRQPWICGMSQAGLRGTGSARRAEVAAARAYGSQLFPAEQLQREGLGPVLRSLPGGSAVYVTIDVDGLDPADMPAVMGPVPGGPGFAQVAALLRSVARSHRIVGLDIVEIAPSFDTPRHITALGAGRLILNAVGAAWGPDGASARAAAPGGR